MAQETTSMNMTVHDDIAESLDELMNMNKAIVDRLVAERPERLTMLRELMNAAYIRGFLCGAHHRSIDANADNDDE
jgi:hypothetical protein